MTLTLPDFTKTIDCTLKKVATVGEPRMDWYYCRNCGGRKLVKARSKKPECLVKAAMTPPAKPKHMQEGE